MDAEYEARMRRIEEKHQALAESHELFQHHMLEMQAFARVLGEKVDKQSETIDKLLVLDARQGERMEALIMTAELHHRRISGLEEES